MAELKLSTVWKIKDFAEKNDRLKMKGAECRFESARLLELLSKSVPCLQWKARLYTAGDELDKDFVSFYLVTCFGSSASDPKSVWANYTATLLDADGNEVATVVCNVQEYGYIGEEQFNGWGKIKFFKFEDVNKAVQKDGSLHIRIDLTILKIREILKCRELLRGLLKNEAAADVEVSVEDQTFKLHRNILLASGMEVGLAGALDLSGTTSPAAFKAFAQAIYFDNWNFLTDVDLTQDVLHLAEKFKALNLKSYCDEYLAEKVNEANALEILTKCAALCNAEKTKAACIDILAEQSGFKQSQVWLDFKQRNRGVALEILEVIHEKVISILVREVEELKRK